MLGGDGSAGCSRRWAGVVVSAFLDVPPGRHDRAGRAGRLRRSPAPVGVLLAAAPARPPVPFDADAAADVHAETDEPHRHEHGPGCGHLAVEHGDHVDYVHDGHRHAVHAEGTMTSTEPPAPRHARPQRQAVLDALDGGRRLPLAPRRSTSCSPRAATRVGLATVYRTLQLLRRRRRCRRRCAARTARRSTAAAPTPTTTTWSAARAARTVEVEGPAVERWTRAIAAEHGFSDVSHTLEIVGTCAACAG